MPLTDSSGTFGALGLYAAEANAFGPEEVRLLKSLADDVSYGIVALRTRRDRDKLEHTLFQVQKLESLGQLTGGIAHDFNNLLQVILGNLDLALLVVDHDTPAGAYLKDAVGAAERGAKLVNGLLAFARRQSLHPASVRLDKLLTEMTSLLGRVIGANIRVHLNIADDLWVVLADPSQLQNAILNLAINARDAMPAGGQLTITAANTTLAVPRRDLKPGDYITLSIADTGSGIPADLLDKVIEPFFTTKPEGKGTGLGLSMVYGFVKQSGGDLDIRSEPGCGTTITLFLPRSEREESVSQEASRAAICGGGETILALEDDDAVRAFVVVQLRKMGYRVLEAADAEAALAILESGEAVDLLFTDVMMPGRLNGLEVAKRARQLRPAIKVMFTSGYVDQAFLDRTPLDLGVVLLTKPYRQAELAAAIRQTLDDTVAPVTRRKRY